MQTEQRSRYRRLFAYLRPHRLQVLAILVLSLGVSGFNAAEPLLSKLLFDQLGERKPASDFAVTLLMLVGLALLKELAGGASNFLVWRTRIRVHYALTEASVGRLHSLPVSFHRDATVGATMTRLERGVQGLVGALGEVAFNLVPAVVYLVMAIVVMLRLDWRLALVVLAFAPLPALIARLAAPEQTERERGLLDRWARIYSRFNEVLSGIVTVKSFAMEDAEKRRFLDQVGEANDVVVRGVARDSRTGAAQNLCITLARVSALGLGAFLIMRGEATMGTLVAFLAYVGGVFSPVQGLAGMYRTLTLAQVSMDQVFGILDAQDSLRDAPDAKVVPPVRGEVAFEDVRFGYVAGKDPILDGITLRARPGETVALVGPSGAGKSTLMALLQRFYDPDSGVVKVDGEDVRALQQVALRRQIGVVLQDSLLFNESVLDNIAYGASSVSRAQVEAAARAANAHDFITRLPQGYDTLVGERGSRLSTGERQRVAIARALLKNPPILILDEPTSALDAESEMLVQEALKQLLKGRTTFIIAHRLSTVVDADRIVVLKKGRILEEGRHEELAAQGGYYASLVRRQIRGLLPDHLEAMAPVAPAVEKAPETSELPRTGT